MKLSFIHSGMYSGSWTLFQWDICHKIVISDGMCSRAYSKDQIENHTY